jgi:hypothetical protein
LVLKVLNYTKGTKFIINKVKNRNKLLFIIYFLFKSYQHGRKFVQRHTDLSCSPMMLRPGWTNPLVAPVVKTLKLAIYLFLDFWVQIYFQKYYIRPNGTQFLINKDKNRGRYLFTFPPMGAMKGSVLPGLLLHKTWPATLTQLRPIMSVALGSCSHRFPRACLVCNTVVAQQIWEKTILYENRFSTCHIRFGCNPQIKFTWNKRI